MGPAPDGRIASAAGVPGDPNTYYLGSASGGLWKSTDGGNTYTSIFDDQAVAAIGSIAVADSDPKIVWVGTGEPWVIRYVDVIGDGVYKSADAGATWKHVGLPETGRIARVLIHPTNPNIVFACAEGRLTGPQEERGVFKTVDGGATWHRVLFVDQKTGCSGLAMDQRDPNTLLAGTWQVEQHTWAQLSGGPGSGVYISHDGGAKWSKVTNGMPKAPVGKVDVAIAPSNPKRMYALIQTADQGSLWRSDDAGVTWTTVSWDRSLIGRAGYYIRLAVNPQNPDDVFISSSSFHRSQDGGKTFSGNGGGPFEFTQDQASCGDCHDIWIDPKDPVRYILTDDAGANINTRQGTDSRGVAERADVSRPRGQPRAVLDIQQSSGRWDDAGAVDALRADRQRCAAGGELHADAARRHRPWTRTRRPGRTRRPAGRTRGWSSASCRRWGHPWPEQHGSGVGAEHRRLRIRLHDPGSD